MTTEEGNVLIAEFMGDSTYKYSLRYHASWNWIMPVVSKIKSLDKDWRISADNVLSLGIATPLDEVWKQVVKFIKHYNSTLPPSIPKP